MGFYHSGKSPYCTNLVYLWLFFITSVLQICNNSANVVPYSHEHNGFSSKETGW